MQIQDEDNDNPDRKRVRPTIDADLADRLHIRKRLTGETLGEQIEQALRAWGGLEDDNIGGDNEDETGT